MLGEDVYRPALNRPLKRQMVLVIGRDLELCPARPFSTKRSTTIDVDTKARLAKAWGTMP